MDATIVFNATQVAELAEYLSVNEQLKILEEKKTKLSNSIKDNMIATKVNELEYKGKKFGISETTRNTVTKKTKDEFIAALVSMGKKNLVNYSIEPDVDSIMAEVNAGTLAKDFVDQYVKVTPVRTLRCS